MIKFFFNELFIVIGATFIGYLGGLIIFYTNTPITQMMVVVWQVFLGIGLAAHLFKSAK